MNEYTNKYIVCYYWSLLKQYEFLLSVVWNQRRSKEKRILRRPLPVYAKTR